MHTTLRLATLLLCLPAAGLITRAAPPAQTTPVPAPDASLAASPNKDNEINAVAAGKSVDVEAPAVEIDPDSEGKTLPPTQLKFSDPTKPGKLRLRVMCGDVTVAGADTHAVTIVSNIKNKQQPAPKNAAGLRRLDSETTFTAVEKNNVITIEIGGDNPDPSAGATLAITTPRSTSVVVENTFGGQVDVRNIEGDADIRSLNGEVTLDQIAGSALVETMNGEIHATFVKVAEGKPLSFTSMNGEIDVRIPADTKANVRLRTQNGAVLTDFDEKALVTKTEAARGRLVTHLHTHHRSADARPNDDPSDSDWQNDIRDTVREATQAGMEAVREAAAAAREAADAARQGVAEARGTPPPAPLPPFPPVLPSISGGKVVSGTLNGGGPEIQIATMNGTITLRKTQP
jgi:Putative adhesin